MMPSLSSRSGLNRGEQNRQLRRRTGPELSSPSSQPALIRLVLESHCKRKSRPKQKTTTTSSILVGAISRNKNPSSQKRNLKLKRVLKRLKTGKVLKVKSVAKALRAERPRRPAGRRVRPKELRLVRKVLPPEPKLPKERRSRLRERKLLRPLLPPQKSGVRS